MKKEFTKQVILKGSTRQAPKAKKKGSADKSAIINITVKLRAGEELPDLLDPKVYASFQPITREEFAKKYGSRSGDVRIVHEFAHRSGLTIVKTEPEKRTIELSGSIGQIQKIFGVSLSNYQDKKGVKFRARKGDIKIPSELAPIVQGIFGLDTRPIASPKFKILNKTKGKKKPKVTQGGFLPTQISKIYNYPQTVLGSGQCVALIELGGGYRPADIDNYFKLLNLNPPTVIPVGVDGGQNSPGSPSGPDGEVMLDIEVAAGIAPGATFVVYFAANTSKAFLAAISDAVHNTQNNVSVISISWGSAEGAAGGWTTSNTNAFNEAFQAASVLGVTVCAAAGDDGSNDGVNDGKVHVDFPASSPYVLACGGTLLSTNSNGGISNEVVWNESSGGATGGGVSDIFPLPSYQQNAGVDLSLNTGKAGRGVPDLAGDADPNSGYNVLVDGQQMQIGGTSAVAPMMAGLIALINQQTKKSSGFIHPKLYANPSVCRDITQGNNDVPPSGKGYSARTGWDACTGNGVADGMELLGIL
jgi:kumamolisin